MRGFGRKVERQIDEIEEILKELDGLDLEDEEPEDADQVQMGCDGSHDEHSCGSDCSVCDCGGESICLYDS